MRSVIGVRGLLAAAVSCACVAVVTGCGVEDTPGVALPGVQGSAIAGVVHGGSQPIGGAKVYLLAVNPTGYGGPGIAASSANASVSLLSASATGHAADSIGSYALTNSATGGFSLSGEYSCTSGFAQGTGAAVALSGSEQVYLYVLGGVPVQTNVAANQSAGLLVALGPCNAPATKVSVNEITTVATAYAFAGFATDATHIGSSGTVLALRGLNNAFGNVANLATVATGAAATSSSSLNVPTANVITIANILAACVNGTTGNANCTTLFKYTASHGATGTVPTDTATAAINLAHNPWPTDPGMAALFGIMPGTGAPFDGALSSQPTDFTLALTVINDGLLVGGIPFQVTGIAIDSQGNAFTPGYSSLFFNDIDGLAEVTSSGVLTFSSPNGGLSQPVSIAIDASDNLWFVNKDMNTVSELANDGTPISPDAGFNGGSGLNDPKGIAIDASGNVWVTNTGVSTLSELTSTGNAAPGSPFSGGGIVNPYGVAVDNAGYIWLADAFGNSLSKFTSTGVPVSVSGYSGGGLTSPVPVAIDAAGNVWAGNSGGSSVSEFSNAGVAVSSSGYSGGGVNNPNGIAIDGAGNVWTANQAGNSVSEFTSAGVALSGSNGFASGSVGGPDGIAIDGSGNVWISDYNDANVIKLIGAATPVVTPIVANLRAPYGKAAVNRP